MIIESVDVRRFGRLSDFKASFDAGFNLIEGPAESGKTTLAAFITYMLYGFPREEGDGLSERALRTPWDGAFTEGSMVFSAAGARYRITRTSEETERGFRDTYALYNLDTDTAEQGELSPGERFLGVSRERFLDTASLSDIRRGGPDAEKTVAAIENILFSGEECLSTATALRTLTESLRELGEAQGATGAVAVLEKERDLLAAQLEEATARERLHFAREEELFLTRKKMEEARAEVEKFSRLETNYHNAKMIDDYDRLHELEDSSDARVAAIRAHEASYRAADFLPDRAYITALTAAGAEVAADEAEVEDADAAYAALPEGRAVVPTEERDLLDSVEAAGGEKAVRERATSVRKRMHVYFSLAGVLAVLLVGALAFFVRALMAKGSPHLFGVLAVLALGGFTVLLVEAIRARRRLIYEIYTIAYAATYEELTGNLQAAAEAKIRIAAATVEKERAAMRLSRAKERLTLAAKTLSDLLAKWGVSSAGGAETVAKTLARAEEYLGEDERLIEEHRAAEAEVTALRKLLAGQNEVAVRARLAPDARRRYRNQNAEDLHRGAEMYAKRLSELSGAERVLVDALAAERRGEPLAAIAERILAIESRIALLRERAAALDMAREAISGGAARLRAEVTPRLSLDACRFLYEMTDGKYSDLIVGEGLSLAFDEGEGEREVAYLSASTEDLTYYALRLALLRLIYRESPPLTLDGCTARQDDERALSFLRAVRTLTEEGKQCFFFASGEREGRLASRVFATYRHVKMQA